MPIEEILNSNRAYSAERPPRPLPEPKRLAVIVLSCFDPRLDDMLLPALGLEPDHAFLFKTAGAYVPPDGETLRSLMVAAIFFQSTELVVVGHTSCRMAHFDTGAFIDAFRARGVRREAFGARDLRDWAGAIPSPRQGVELSVQHILSEPARPRDLTVSGLLLNDTTGALERVVSGELAPEPSALSEDGEPEGLDSSEPASPPPPPSDVESDETLVATVDELARAIRSKTEWRYEAARLRQQLSSEKNPTAKLRLLSEFVQRIGSDSADVATAFKRLTALALRPDASVDAKKLSDVVNRLLKRL